MRSETSLAWLGVWAAAVAGSACSDPPTEVVVRVTTDLPQGCASGLASVRVEVTANGVRAFQTELALDASDPRARLPRGGLLPSG